jgi:hypothetical protein
MRLYTSNKKRKHRAARRYAMFSGGEKIVFFLLPIIGYTTGGTLAEKPTILVCL